MILKQGFTQQIIIFHILIISYKKSLRDKGQTQTCTSVCINIILDIDFENCLHNEVIENKVWKFGWREKKMQN